MVANEAALRPAAEAEFKEAEALFHQGQLASAEAKFQKIAKQRKQSHWGETAQFHLAECQYQQGHLKAATDSYEVLLSKYPGTQFLDKAVAREYAIAEVWLAAVDPEAKPEQKASFSDRRRGKFPMVDISGHALATFEHVRHHDPTGPLADDAVMKIADYHFAHENWEEAWIHYDQLVTDHPKSPMVQKALLSSIDSKMKGYLGPDYDGTGLEQAKNQVVQTMANFPERQASHSDELYHTLDMISELQAERAYRVGEHYLWTGKVTSAEYTFGEIPVKWPKSPYAKKAKEQLAVIATLPRKETLASKIMTQPGGSDPLTGSPGVTQGMGGPNGIGGGGGGFMGGMGP